MEQHHTAVIGTTKNFWLYDSRTGFDLTHPPTPAAHIETPRLSIQTSSVPIMIDPMKSALVIIDMQNYFLSPALGRERGPGHDAVDQLLQYGIPAARKAGIRVIWVNWGLSQEEIDDMPPAVLRAFGFEGDRGGESVTVDKHGNISPFTGDDEKSNNVRSKRKYKGMGSDMGRVTDPESGRTIDAGKLLMRDQWNSALVPDLDKLYKEGKNLQTRPDVWIHKNRMSGSWTKTALVEFLEEEGLRSLLFSGVNTDQCVGGTYQDCFSKGFDCILLEDGCGTTSPSFAQKTVEFNAENTFGFRTTCKDLAEGVNDMKG